jgi:type II secretory pathway pseudopilin PulG
MIVIAILSTLVALAIVATVRSRVNANEAAVRSDLRTFSSANESFRAAQNPPSYAGNISTLTGSTPPYIDTTWDSVGVPPGKHGFTMAYAVAGDGSTYSMLANPIAGQAVNIYCIDHSGILYRGGGGSAAGCNGGVYVSS